MSLPEPYYADATTTLHVGDCLDVLAAMDEASVDAVVCDPPYALGFMGKEWDRPGSAARGYKTDDDLATNPYSRARSEYGGGSYGAITAGLPFQRWCEQWAFEALRVLKPGGYLLAFGGSRTYHRLAAGVEDAGFEVRDQLQWLYGSGFPKSLDVSKAIDKRPGVGRHAEFAAELREAVAANGYTNTFDVAEQVVGRRTGAVANWQKYQWPDAKWWPALRDLLGMDAKWDEVIAEAERRKVRSRSGNELVVAPGQGEPRGAVDIDVTVPATPEAQRWDGWGTALKPAHEPVVMARKPLAGTVASNVLTWGSGAVNIDGCRVEGGGRKGEGGRLESATGSTSIFNAGAHNAVDDSRGRWPANVVVDEDAADMLDQQSGYQRDGVAVNRNRGDTRPQTVTNTPAQVLHDDAGYGGEGGASRFFYVAKAGRAERDASNHHPTVKPVALMRWLIRLVTPPDGVVVDPFAGSGTTGVAAAVESKRCVLIEREPEYADIVVRRLSKPIEPTLDGLGGAA